MSQMYGPLKLPKSGKEIHFREPTGGDRLEVLKQNPVGGDDFVSGQTLSDLYLAAKCVAKVDGKETNAGDYKFLFQSWSNADVNYYKAVFDKVFSVGKEDLEKLDSVVDFLLNGSGSTVSSS